MKAKYRMMAERLAVGGRTLEQLLGNLVERIGEVAETPEQNEKIERAVRAHLESALKDVFSLEQSLEDALATGETMDGVKL